jgi:DNA-directed RNA polymerase specialized sigma24 family protein
MKHDPYTEIGGVAGAFLTTHWSVIEKVGSADHQDQALIGLLINKYWKPVYCYLRYQGHDNEQAKDLTQGFFHQVVLGRNLFDKADQAKGRFRTFLIMALNRYLIQIQQKQSARKRIPQTKLVPLDNIDLPDIAQAHASLSPEDAFNYAWVSTLLEEVLSEVEATCRQRHLMIHWQAFKEKILEPILEGYDPPSLQDLCERHGIEDTTKASNMIGTVKKIFRGILEQHVRRSVLSDEDMPEELIQIKRFFQKSRQD